MAEAHAHLREIREVHEALQVCFSDLEKVLSARALNPGALTSVRLKLAGIRLSRGPLITRIATLLQGNVTEAEERLAGGTPVVPPSDASNGDGAHRKMDP